jgi:hypothetical protein
VLGWDERAIHWGSISSHASEPRISVAAEFLAADAEPNADEFPLLNIGTLPSFRQRPSIIAKVIDDYQRFETILGRYSEFTRLLQGLVST